MSTESPHSSPKEHFLVGFLIVIVAALVTVRLHETAFLHWADLANLDVWILIHKPEPAPDIAIVDITDDDYGALFNSQSPLSPPRVRTLIWAITAANPKSLGIDLDTSAWDPSQRQWLVDKVKIDQTTAGSVPIVWALGGDPLDPPGSKTPGSDPSGSDPSGSAAPDSAAPDSKAADSKAPDSKAAGGNEAEVRVAFDSVKGGMGSYCWGVPTVLPETDGIVRSYMRSVEDATGHRLFGFAGALVAVNQGGMPACLQGPKTPAAATSAKTEPYPRIAFSGGPDAFQHFSASLVLGAAFSEAWKIANPLRGKTVFLGGSFRAARDKYVTPIGYLDGVDILAHSYQSLSSTKGLREVGKNLFLWIDLALGATLVILTYWKKLLVEILAFLLIPIISLLASLLIYDSLGYFASVMPVMLGVAVHKLLEHIVEHHKLNREVKRLRKELHNLKAKKV